MNDTPPPPQHRQLLGNAEYMAAIDELLARARQRVRVFDQDLAEGGWQTPARIELLQNFLRHSGARLEIVAHDLDWLARHNPRFVGLLRTHAHAIAVQQTESQARGVYDPFVLVDGRDCLHRFHFQQPRALLALDDPQETHALEDRFEEIWLASRPALAVTTLGL